MSKVFKMEGAQKAAGMIPGLSDDERQAVALKLGDVSRFYHAPDAPMGEAKEILVTLTDKIGTLEKDVRTLMVGWPDPRGRPPAITRFHEKASLHLANLKHEAARVLEDLGSLRPVKGRGLMGQTLGMSKKEYAFREASWLWFFSDLAIPERVTGPGKRFVDAAFEVITGIEPDAARGLDDEIVKARKRLVKLKRELLKDPNLAVRWTSAWHNWVLLLDKGGMPPSDPYWPEAIIYRRFLFTADRHYRQASGE